MKNYVLLSVQLSWRFGASAMLRHVTDADSQIKKCLPATGLNINLTEHPPPPFYT